MPACVQPELDPADVTAEGGIRPEKSEVVWGFFSLEETRLAGMRPCRLRRGSLGFILESPTHLCSASSCQCSCAIGPAAQRAFTYLDFSLLWRCSQQCKFPDVQPIYCLERQLRSRDRLYSGSESAKSATACRVFTPKLWRTAVQHSRLPVALSAGDVSKQRSGRCM